MAIMYQGCLVPLYCFSLFSPTLTANLGYKAATAQLMSVPPYIAAAVATVACGYFSDRIQKRAILAICMALVAMFGFILLIATNNAGVNYAGLMFAAIGIYPLIPIILSWSANNVGGSLKKGVATAIVVSFGNAGGVISSFCYPKTDKPRYTKGHAINIAYCGVIIVTASFMWIYYNRENKRKEARNAARSHPWTEEERKAQEDNGDKNDYFHYTI